MTRPRAAASTGPLDQLAFWAVLATPPLLLHAHGIAEVMIGIADVAFLARSALLREWAWLRTPWLRVAGLWWGWLVVCSLPLPALHLGEGGPRMLVQAVATVRFLVLLACLEHQVLRPGAARRWFFGMIAASTAWIALNALVQNEFGRNLLGYPRSGDGELTGPFERPRAGPAIVHTLLASILPPAAALLHRRRPGPTAAAYALLLSGVMIMVLIGQRMPLVIAVLGLVAAAVLLRPLRPAILSAAVAGGLLLAASPVVAPSAYYRLVEKFSYQLEHFAVSPYGIMYARAWEIGVSNPVTGMGFDGFGTGCPRPAYFRPTFDGSVRDGYGAHFCWDHPHNYYLQALDDGGFVGLALFAAMGAAWLLTLGRGLWRHPTPIRVALFATVLADLFPIQSTTAFTSMPVGGWFFLMLGWGLAEARWRDQLQAQPSVAPAPPRTT